MTKRSLQHFFDMLCSAQQANRAKFPVWCGILERMDSCFVTAGKSLINPKPVMPGNLLLRCQYAFKTAVGMALAGQVVEVFVMQRSVLEYAGYGLRIFERPELDGVFVLRHIGPDEQKAQKEAFKTEPSRRPSNGTTTSWQLTLMSTNSGRSTSVRIPILTGPSPPRY
jgi:hypothetical protein